MEKLRIGDPLVRAMGAVNTPVRTQFLTDAAAAGLQIMSGHELILGQDVDAWALFTGLPLDEARLRADPAAGQDTE